MKINEPFNVIIKLSGEALEDEVNFKIFSKTKLDKIVELIKKLQERKINVGIVCGAGNIFRGRIAEENGIRYEDGDYLGMIGTVINLKALSSILDINGIKNKLYSALEVEDVAPKYDKDEAKKYLEKGYVVLFAGGVGKVRHTTDSCAALRAKEMNAKLILAGKHGVDGIYSKDPNKYQDAEFIKELTYTEALDKKIAVMDKEALETLENTDVVTHIFSSDDYDNYLKVIDGESIGSIIKKEA